MFGDISPTAHALANSEWDNGTWPANMRRLERRRTKTLRRALRLARGTRLLDIGCSNGSLLGIASRLGFEAEGFEPSVEAAKDGIRRGFKIHSSLDVPGPYDIITMFEVIEHIRDPIPLLTACKRLLSHSGVLVIGTGNTDSWTFRAMGTAWDYMYPGTGHINFYSSKSLATLVSRVGFAVTDICTKAVTLRTRGTPYYRLFKLAGQALALPARLLGKGEQLELYCRVGPERDALRLGGMIAVEEAFKPGAGKSGTRLRICSLNDTNASGDICS